MLNKYTGFGNRVGQLSGCPTACGDEVQAHLTISLCSDLLQAQV